MNSLIETARQAHEEVDLYEQALAAIFLQPDKTHKHKLDKEHRASDILDRIVARKQFLSEHYADEHGTRAAEVALLAAPAPPAEDLEEFYSRLVSIKEFHHAHPNVDSRAADNEIKALVEGSPMDVDGDEPVDKVASLFSGEEGLGRFLDLYLYHSQFINLKSAPKIPYLPYFDMLGKGAPDESLDRKSKSSPEYLSYITALHSYLLSFSARTRPLTDLLPAEEEAATEFDAKWKEGTVEGWELESEGPAAAEGSGSAEGIWCAACQKLYSKQTVYDAHLKSKKHEKAAARLQASAAPADGADASAAAGATSQSLAELRQAKLRPAALLTFQTRALLLSPAFAALVADTKANVERRSALTARERELEMEEPAVELAPVAEDGTAADDDEDADGEEKIYNPLKLPLGWDGKPIPYWLYKLHGLGQEFVCEICSGFKYMGRKTFERHFQESRHSYGMKALGLPNTKHFAEITKIEDAMALAEKLKHEGKQEAKALGDLEEVEDSEGNVLSRRDYEDLKRQGLI